MCAYTELQKEKYTEKLLVLTQDSLATLSAKKKVIFEKTKRHNTEIYMHLQVFCLHTTGKATIAAYYRKLDCFERYLRYVDTYLSRNRFLNSRVFVKQLIKRTKPFLRLSQKA